MNTKIMTSVGCLLLLAAAIAPSVLGHSQRTVSDADLGSGYAAVASNGVSGRYVGSAGPAVADISAGGLGTFANGGMLCDAEVVLDDPAFVGNEKNVDGALVAGGVENFWDDGGEGGACHTDHYTETTFNTSGCQGGQLVNAKTHAGTEVWVGASCDWKTDQGGVSSEQTLVLCLTSALFAFNPLDPLLTELQPFVDCLVAFADCLLDPACGATGATQSCGADATSDAVNYGYGSTGGQFNTVGTPLQARFPAATGIVNAPPGVTGPCAPGDETAGVFVWDAVVTNLASVEVLPALTGELWS